MSTKNFRVSDGDWICPDKKCGNVNFARRTSCNRCGREKTTEAKMMKAGGTEIGKTLAEKSRGLFSANDWQCKTCSNVNWARRSECNMCNTPKYAKLEERTGYGGGFNERENVEYIEREESDGEYDEFGRKKKKYRGKAVGPASILKEVEDKESEGEEEDEDEDLSKYKLDEDEDEDDADLSKYNLDASEEEDSNKKKANRRSRSKSRSSHSRSSSRSSSPSSSRSRSSVHITELKNVVLGKKNASVLFQVPFKKLFQLAVKVSLRFQRTFQISWFEIKVNELYFSPRKLVPLPQLNLTSECVPGHP
ncbi:hypothetical protein U0070_024588 [Myodes glareolus]|uniref:Zinc finger Ran-binding domain-containing protein 2 n=1 Tax=Myodes glareolus TaxID=447135 RepID=A0AAW0IDD3_MYOGA